MQYVRPLEATVVLCINNFPQVPFPSCLLTIDNYLVNKSIIKELNSLRLSTEISFCSRHCEQLNMHKTSLRIIYHG